MSEEQEARIKELRERVAAEHRPLTLRDFKDFLNGLPADLDNRPLQYVDFSWAKKSELICSGADSLTDENLAITA
jgi:hypothetical protein